MSACWFLLLLAPFSFFVIQGMVTRGEIASSSGVRLVWSGLREVALSGLFLVLLSGGDIAEFFDRA